ncbi:hypothetical protein HCN44_002866 [Aphidius gifuensis]|uniref:Uncharacterized protein n=1 Tax=Aphidius gifuensis TaxID=684658 RepID=A0A835CNZ3_APHGI|nr:uncharacterized protein LOC122854295 [Aphidius gifuensis]XP_044010741.1 uncharacterized protein LOC122854295 [Aphidius gifuensis]KAF7991304.1 hypothetical protein HCN44_002866 [Aphidius gifuensis]
MAVRKGKLEDVPEHAVICNYEDAIIHQWSVIKQWPKLSEVWPFKIGLPMVTTTAAWTGWKINSLIRRKLKLFSYGLGTTQLAMALAPALFVGSCHLFFVTSDVFFESNQCLLCLQQKAALIQGAFGIGYPLVMSPIANFMYATRHGTYNLPHWADYKGTLQLYFKLIKPMGPTILKMLVLQTFFTAFIVYQEKLSIEKMRVALENEEKLLEKEGVVIKQRIYD